MRRETAITYETTVPLYAIIQRKLAGGHTIRDRVWITEMDVTLDLAVWDNDEADPGYELRGVTTPAGYVTMNSDAAWFKLICEGLDDLHQDILEHLASVEPGISAPRLEAAE